MVKINSLSKVVTSLLTLVFFGLLASTVYASEESPDSKLLNESQVKISVTNDQTGETKILNPIETYNNVKVESIESIDVDEDTTIKRVGYSVFVPIESLESSDEGLITPFTVDGDFRDSGGVTATLYVDYNWNESDGEIKVNRLYGGWDPSSSIYYLSNREASVHSGILYGEEVNLKPTSNSFSYTTGWGYNYAQTGGDFAPRAWSSAKVHISGMSSTHTIELDFTFPE